MEKKLFAFTDYINVVFETNSRFSVIRIDERTQKTELLI